jgi:hypothetical protein
VVWIFIGIAAVAYTVGFVLGHMYGFERGRVDGEREGRKAWDALRGAGPKDEPF